MSWWRHLVDQANPALRKLPVWPLYLLGLAYVGGLFALALTGGLGVEPIEALEHALGEKALQLLLIGLAITPLRRLTGLNLIRFRRAIGLVCFFFVLVHLLVWLVLDVQIPAQIWADIVKRPYVTIGMAGFLLLLPLAITSNDRSVRRLGRRWQSLHRLVYPAAILAVLHFLMLVKGFQIEPLVYGAILIGLLVLRRPFGRRRATA